MKQIVILVLFLFTNSFLINSQNTVLISDPSMSAPKWLSEKGKGNYSSTVIEGVVGSPLVFPSFQLTTLLKTTSGETFDVPNGNYNSYTDNLVSKITNDSIFTFNDNNIEHIYFGKIKAKKYTVNNTRRYLFTLKKGIKLTLLKSYQSKIKEGKVNPMTMAKMSNDKLITNSSYFVLSNNNQVKSFSLKKKSILSLLKDKKQEIATYVKSNKLSFKEEKDVIKVFNYYNSL